ncbi:MULTISPECIES: hypothetical protein [unclassified Sphingobium]|uniref:hypothetical protein n=1 Tax=unclassified Sphingobium TaxID=2611147 RepID=UPI0022244279|nr:MULTISPECIES: hypothetical protein [unclassified Sphingobium]MCW2394407.1 putative membrane protein [Sphingobium sp. B8D3B]MCW2417921.1 putative membrane protein [Sphingobium sp. B8D3C]
MADMIAHSLWFVLAFVLVGSSLALRRLPLHLVKMILIWIAIFAAVWIVVLAFRGLSG